MRSDFININSNKLGDGADVGNNSAAMELQYRDKIVLLEDQGGSGGAIRSALTLADSGTHFIVPALTGGAHTLSLPAVAEASVGCWFRFTMIGLAAQVFSLDTAASADKIITWEPDGDGTGTINASADGFNFTAAATKGASFKITMISSTAATAWAVSDLHYGLAAMTGEHVAE